MGMVRGTPMEGGSPDAVVLHPTQVGAAPGPPGWLGGDERCRQIIILITKTYGSYEPTARRYNQMHDS